MDNHIYTFKFITKDDAIDFINSIREVVDVYDQITLSELEEIADYVNYDFTHRKIIWRRSDLYDHQGIRPYILPTPTLNTYEVVLPEPGINPTGKVYSTEPVAVDGIHVENNPKSPQPISITVNAAEFSEDLFLQTIREVVESAAKIKDRDILINIIRA